MDPILIVVVVVVAVALWFVVTYNSLVTRRNRVENAWGQVDVQLGRRNDLIPNLVETVKGYAAHERQTLEDVIDARNRSVAATGPEETAQAENLLTGALRQLFAIAEDYPDLRASENFAGLQEELSETESAIAVARQIYNDTVLGYNNQVQRIPGNIVAGITGFRPKEYFDAPEGTERPPEVRF